MHKPGMPACPLQGTLGLVDAAFSGDWSRIGVLTTGRPPPARPHAAQAPVLLQDMHRAGQTWRVDAVMAMHADAWRMC